MTKSPYKMEIDINVLNHLGIGLYSNVPAILAEVIANAWDADATEVRIELSKIQESIISIEDNGTGLNEKEINERFLRVGYQRRKIQGKLTQKNRKPMGRKGIGKLSLFSIAKIIEVYTCNGKEKNAFRMNLDHIRNKQDSNEKSDNMYEPSPIEFSEIISQTGTKIIIKDLNKKITNATVTGLTRRLARRFTVRNENFSIYINDMKIKTEHRGYYKKIQFVWIYGNEISEKIFVNKISNEIRENIVHENYENLGKILITGWLGTVVHPRDLDEDGENLNRIAIYIRGKMAKEDMLNTLSENSVYASYIVGEINVDWMDDDNENDMVTTDRQGFIEEDDRYEILKIFIKKEMRYIDDRWKNLRTDLFIKKEIVVIPQVKKWLEELPSHLTGKAKKWLGRLATITGDNADKKELLKAAIFAFEFYTMKDNLDKLNTVHDKDINAVLSIFKDIDNLETSFYGQIIKGRLKIIKSLEEKLNENDKEIVIQRHIFNHLWLLDPSFERAQGTAFMEKSVQKILIENTDKLTREEKNERIDIGYRTLAGKHVIVELKRKSVKISVHDLAKQIGKYRSTIKKSLLEYKGYETWPLEIICLLGEQPYEYHQQQDGKEIVPETLKQLDARVVCYDTLLNNAQTIYADYIEQNKKVDRLWEIFNAIENFVPNEK